MASSSYGRREEIVRLTMTSGPTSVEELSVRLGVTASTIRRDLARLTREGRLARTYGGVMALVAHPEPPLRERARQGHEAKGGIAQWVAAEISAGESILLDTGSTTTAIARELRHHSPLSVATTGLAVLAQLADADGIQVECLGGTLRRLSQGFVGPLAEAALERMSFDRVFLGADGVSADDGICEADLLQTRLKELMIKRSQRVYVVAHAAKLGHRPFHAWCPMPPVWTLVTDDAATGPDLAPFRAAGVDVVVTTSGGTVVQVA